MTEPTEDRPAIRIVLEFAPELPADPTVRLENVTVGQIAAAAWLLERLAVEQRNAAMIQAAQERAAVAQLAHEIQRGGR